MPTEDRLDPGTGAMEDVDGWRDRVLRTVALWVFILGTIAYVPGVWLAIRDGIPSIVVVDTVALVGVAVLAFHRRLSYRSRALGLLAILYFLSLGLLVVLGPLGAGMMWLFTFPIMAGVFLGTWPAAAAIVLTTLSLAALSALAATGHLAWSEDMAADPMLWVTYAGSFLVLNVMVTMSISVLLRRIEDGALATRRALADRERAEAERIAMEAQLRQSQKMEALGTLAGGIAHDFNNLLVPIIGTMEMAREQADPAGPVADLLGDGLRAANRGRDLVRGILAFSRHGHTDRSPIPLADEVAECRPLLRPTIGPGIELVVRDDAPDAQVVAAPGEVQQVIVNLATNAATAMAGTGRLVIELAPAPLATLGADPVPPRRAGRVHIPRLAPRTGDAEPAGWVRIRVEDTGPGMAPSTLERVLEPFFTTAPPGRGTGLGLPIVHGIVQALGGELAIESGPGQGTVVEVLLPTTRPVAADPATADTRPFRPGGTEHILVVDDDDGARLTVARMLRRLGYFVSEADSAHLAIDALDALDALDANGASDSDDPIEASKATGALDRAPGVHLVVTDLSMPGMSGLELADAIARRADPVPVMLITGHAAADLADDARAAVTTILGKPFGLDDLARVVRETLDGSETIGPTGPHR